MHDVTVPEWAAALVAVAKLHSNGAKKKQLLSSAIEPLFLQSRWSSCSIELRWSDS
jgi:hypothetical protein